MQVTGINGDIPDWELMGTFLIGAARNLVQSGMSLSLQMAEI
jgi:hypothetical protein